MRLFVAVNFSKEVKDTLMEVSGMLKSAAASGNFTRRENLHLTLAFIGETANVGAAMESVEEVAANPFDITLGGVGRFGKLFWVGVKESGKLRDLAMGVDAALSRRGFDIEKRDFKPHVTIAREVEVLAPVKIAVPGISMRVDALSLMKSERVGGRLCYSEIYKKMLK